jgi:hypothetical protein
MQSSREVMRSSSIRLFVNRDKTALETHQAAAIVCVCVCVCVCVRASHDPSNVFYCPFSQILCPAHNQDTLPFPYYKRVPL